MDHNLFKISKLWTCLCGWNHVSQGASSCWVCKQKHDPVPMNNARQVYEDMQAMRWSSQRMHDGTCSREDRTDYDMGWPSEAGFGKELRGELI